MLKKQRGLTMISWMLVLGILGVQGVMAVRVAPVYMNYYSAKDILDSLPENKEAATMTPQNLRKLIGKRFNVNNLYSLSANTGAIKFEKKKAGFAVILQYEERGPILGNLEFVATFNHEVILTGAY